MKASNLIRGSLAVRRAKLPLASDPSGNGADLGSAGSSAPEVGLKPLNGIETAEVLQRAREFASSRGVTEPKEDDELYQYGKAVWSILLGCVDPDEPKARFFDGGLDQLLGLLGRDEVLLLSELQEQWQQECSPMVKDFSEEQVSEAIDTLAGPAGSAFFLSLRPGLRWNLVRSMAALLRSSQPGRSISGSTHTYVPESVWKALESEQSEQSTIPQPTRAKRILKPGRGLRRRR
jgi:hypothetical protein